MIEFSNEIKGQALKATQSCKQKKIQVLGNNQQYDNEITRFACLRPG